MPNMTLQNSNNGLHDFLSGKLTKNGTRIKTTNSKARINQRGKPRAVAISIKPFLAHTMYIKL